eukprot:maker-scaffold_55-snap-gene-0.43-mRNA-1 protein AED:0.02 eAED:0.02 QI:365/1/1/1/0.33/0.25/4/483/232
MSRVLSLLTNLASRSMKLKVSSINFKNMTRSTSSSFFNLSQSGEIEFSEFSRLLREPESFILRAVFDLVDSDQSGKIDFNEFVLVMGTYCMFSKEDILRFFFDSFDEDGSGTLDEQEFQKMCLDLNSHKRMYSGNFYSALKEVDQSGDGLIDFKEFKELSRKYPMLAYPVFLLQQKLQEATLGTTTWENIMVKRKEKEEALNFQDANDGWKKSKTICSRLKTMFFGDRTGTM